MGCVDGAAWMNTVKGTWSFKKKRFPSGLLKKLKARHCARGDTQQEGVDHFETCSPVVNWTTARLMLILTAQLQLETKQVDHAAAFAHADIDKPPLNMTCQHAPQRELLCEGKSRQKQTLKHMISISC